MGQKKDGGAKNQSEQVLKGSSDGSIVSVYMDETGNKESDRFFICGFLRVTDNEQFMNNLSRVREQIEARASFNRNKKVEKLYDNRDIQRLYKFTKPGLKFELKYKLVGHSNLGLFKGLIKALVRKVDFKFDAIVIDRQDPAYNHTSLMAMYKIITRQYFSRVCREDCIFIPDSFNDHSWNWRNSLNYANIKAIIPASSHSLIYLQAVDILSGIIGQALKDKDDYTNKDKLRQPLVEIFEKEAKITITRNVTVNKPRYINIWTMDFSKAKK